MPTEIESLQIKIQAEATKANDAIDRLDDKLERLEKALQGLEKSNITGFANGVDRLSKAMVSMNQVKTADFTRLANNLSKLSTINVSGLNSSASSVIMLSKAFNQLSAATQTSSNVALLASSLSKLGNKGVQNAITNIPLLSNAMKNMFQTLATAPKINRNIIDMTNALANLSSQGSKVGTASNRIVSGLNKTNTAMARTKSQATSLASAFGKFYASYFLIIRGVKGLWSAIEDSMDYVETYNYFNVALGKIGEETSARFGEFGKESAESYAEEFGKRLNELNKKMTGYIVDDEGGLQLAGDMGLGLNIEQMMNFQAKVLSVTNSVGLMGEASVNTAKAVSMLAGDISSLTNVDVESVMESLTSGLIGQSRALYKYGIDITNNTLQQYAYAEGINKAVSEMTQSEKMQLRLLAILDQSEVAWGDLANTVDSVANQYRIFQQQIQNLGRTFGSLFLPIVKNVLPYVNGLVIALNNLFTSLGFSMYGDTWLSDLQDGISGSIQGDIEELEDGLEDASDAANKLKKNLSSFDELDVISISGVSSAADAENVIDLTESIAGALSKYEENWNEAFEGAQNKAAEFAKELTNIFESAKFIEGFEEISTSLKDFVSAAEPFTKGFGDGFVKFLSDLSKITLDAVVETLNVFSDVLEKIPEDTLEELGGAIGGFTAAALGFGVATSAISKITTSVQALSTVLSANQVTLAIGAVVALSGAFVGWYNSLEGLDDERFNDIADNLKDELSDLSNVFSGFSTSMSDITNKKDAVTSALEDYYKLLNDDSIDFEEKKFQLQGYVNYITREFPQLSSFVSEHTGLFATNKEEILSNIDAVTEYAKTVAAQDMLTSAYKEYYEGLAEYKNLFNAYNEMVAQYDEEYGLYNLVLPWEFKQQKADQELRAAYDEMYEYQQILLTAQEKIKGIEDLISSLSEKSDPLNNVSIGASESADELEEVKVSLEEITENLDVLDGKTIEIPIEFKYVSGNPFKSFVNFSDIPMHYTGGFPEDGLFMANHNELVGKFSNGKTAVANNQQIVEGIKQGVYDAVVSAMGTNKNKSGDIVINMDGNEVFRVVQNRANEFYEVNGQAAFNF